MNTNHILLLAQVQPGVMLITGLVILIAVLLFLWPSRGGLALLAKLKKSNQRVMLEDALKFIYDQEYNKMLCHVDSVAGHLNISTDKAGRLVNRLSSLDLIVLNNQAVTLTDAGRSYALRIIRIHRIWERYLADETSVDQADWHNEACKIEHEVSLEDTEKLAAQLGNPVFDPHGDPIPTIHGEMPEKKGKSLSEMEEGEMGRITHLEDEPKSIYEQLVVLGLYPGMQVYVTNVSDKKITFVADGEECILTPLFAGYITVEAVEAEVVNTEKHELLSALKMGEFGEITGISPNCRGQQRRRLMDLGIVPGGRISAVIKSASGDPVGYRVLGTTIGIRKQQADMVFIQRIKEKHHEYAE